MCTLGMRTMLASNSYHSKYVWYNTYKWSASESNDSLKFCLNICCIYKRRKNSDKQKDRAVSRANTKLFSEYFSVRM